MGMQINTNVSALNSYRNLSNTQNDPGKSLEKLSSGLRINRAADDAAGLAISEGLRSQVGGLKMAARNAQDAISVIQTAEGGLTETTSILQRLRDLAVQAGNDSNNAQSREAITTEATALVDELGRISETTNFNGINLLSGNVTGDPDADLTAPATSEMKFQVGANGDDSSQIGVSFEKANVKAIATALTATAAVPPAEDGTGGAPATGLNFSTSAGAKAAITLIDTQIDTVSTARSSLGAAQNRFESTINTLNVSAENLTAAESRIRDTDMASEMVSYTRSNILSQAGTAMLAQANQSNQGVLQLLG